MPISSTINRPLHRNSMVAAGHLLKSHSLANKTWWCWVVLASTFYITFNMDGFNFSFGIIKLYILEEYKGNASETTVSLIGGLVPALYCLLAPVAFGLVTVFTVRNIAIVGGVLSTLGFGIVFVNQYLHWGFVVDFIGLGVLQGLAGACLFGPSIDLIATYFRFNHKALATGITTCGSPVGTIVYSYLIHILIDQFGFRGTILFFTIASACVIPLCFTFIHKKSITHEDLDEGPIKDRLKESFSNVFEKELLKDRVFILLMIAYALSILSYFVPTLLIVEQSLEAKYRVTENVRNLLIPLWGVTQLIGRVSVGWLADFGNKCFIFTPLSLFMTGLILSSALMFTFPHVMIHGNAAFLTFVCIYGLISAPFITLRSTLVQDMFYDRPTLIASSFGWGLAAEGLVIVFGFFLPTILNNMDPLYAYLFSALSFLMSALFLSMTIPRFIKMHKLKKNDCQIQ